MFIKNTQEIYLASNTELEHSFAEGGLPWLDEELASIRSLPVKNPDPKPPSPSLLDTENSFVAQANSSMLKKESSNVNQIIEPKQAPTSSIPNVQVCIRSTAAILQARVLALLQIHTPNISLSLKTNSNAYTGFGFVLGTPLSCRPFHGPTRYLTFESSNSINSGYPSGTRMPVNDLTPRSDIKIERVRAVKTDIRINTAYVSISQSQCLVKCRPERALGVLSKTIKRRPVFRKRRGELDIED
ncbi:hypothetical protein SADUNF_Sadunf11G0114700 [Salix dunnii]|uniref:Uncharacterized protein n=1 Tax=Salix dunnii TaxID=1413687 RepID=A0A835JPY3_9ROSI|nr:hypothetical protein SADUNF_Sadunf11G0114700 [Salix dunnii]